MMATSVQSLSRRGKNERMVKSKWTTRAGGGKKKKILTRFSPLPVDFEFILGSTTVPKFQIRKKVVFGSDPRITD